MSREFSAARNPSPSTSKPPSTTQSRAASPGLSRSSSNPRPVRRKSLRLSNQLVDTPIPPSLLESPYLNSPESIFKRAVTSPRHPSKEDEKWLQDTVPLSPDAREDGGQRARPMGLPSAEELRIESRGSPEQRSVSHQPTPSPPRSWRYPITPTPPVWLGHAKTRSAPTTQGYFVVAV